FASPVLWIASAGMVFGYLFYFQGLRYGGATISSLLLEGWAPVAGAIITCALSARLPLAGEIVSFLLILAGVSTLSSHLGRGPPAEKVKPVGTNGATRVKLGVSIGTASVRVGYISVDDKGGILGEGDKCVIHSVSADIPRGANGLTDVAEAVRIAGNLLRRSRLDVEAEDWKIVKGVGVSAPGAYLNDGSVYPGTVPNIPGLENIRLHEALQKEFGGDFTVAPANVNNDGVLQGLVAASYYVRSHPDFEGRKIAVLVPGVGFGAGIYSVEEGEVAPLPGPQQFYDVVVRNATPGETVVVRQGEKTEVRLARGGEPIIMDDIVSGRALELLAGVRLGRSVTIHELNEMALEGDEAAREVFRIAGRALARFMIRMNTGTFKKGVVDYRPDTVGVELFLIGGAWMPTGGAREFLLEAAEEHLKEKGAAHLRIVRADEVRGMERLTGHLGVIGATLLAHETDGSVIFADRSPASRWRRFLQFLRLRAPPAPVPTVVKPEPVPAPAWSFYNQASVDRLQDLLTGRLRDRGADRPLVVAVDGEENVGRIQLAESLSLPARTKVIHLEDFAVPLEEPSGDYATYVEQFNMPVPKQGWDWDELWEAIEQAARAGYEVILVEGIGVLNAERRDWRFDVRVNVIADDRISRIFQERAGVGPVSRDPYYRFRYATRPNYDMVVENVHPGSSAVPAAGAPLPVHTNGATRVKVGVDIGGTSLRVGFVSVDDEGRIVGQGEKCLVYAVSQKMPRTETGLADGPEAVKWLGRMILEAVEEVEHAGWTVSRRLGVSAPGAYLEDGNVYPGTVRNVPSLEKMKLYEALGAELGPDWDLSPASVNNDGVLQGQVAAAKYLETDRTFRDGKIVSFVPGTGFGAGAYEVKDGVVLPLPGPQQLCDVVVGAASSGEPILVQEGESLVVRPAEGGEPLSVENLVTGRALGLLGSAAFGRAVTGGELSRLAMDGDPRASRIFAHAGVALARFAMKINSGDFEKTTVAHRPDTRGAAVFLAGGSWLLHGAGEKITLRVMRETLDQNGRGDIKIVRIDELPGMEGLIPHLGILGAASLAPFDRDVPLAETAGAETPPLPAAGTEGEVSSAASRWFQRFVRSPRRLFSPWKTPAVPVSSAVEGPAPVDVSAPESAVPAADTAPPSVAWPVYNAAALEKLRRFIGERLEQRGPAAARPLLVAIDGDSDVGKTEFSERLNLNARTKILHIDDFYHEVPPASGDYLAYVEQFDYPVLEEYWDFPAVAREVSQAMNSGLYDVVIVEGLKVLKSELDDVRFDVRVNVTADMRTRDLFHRMKQRMGGEQVARRLTSYLEKYSKQYLDGERKYDVVVDNSIPADFTEEDLLRLASQEDIGAAHELKGPPLAALRSLYERLLRLAETLGMEGVPLPESEELSEAPAVMPTEELTRRLDLLDRMERLRVGPETWHWAKDPLRLGRFVRMHRDVLLALVDAVSRRFVAALGDREVALIRRAARNLSGAEFERLSRDGRQAVFRLRSSDGGTVRVAVQAALGLPMHAFFADDGTHVGATIQGPPSRRAVFRRLADLASFRIFRRSAYTITLQPDVLRHPARLSRALQEEFLEIRLHRRGFSFARAHEQVHARLAAAGLEDDLPRQLEEGKDRYAALVPELERTSGQLNETVAAARAAVDDRFRHNRSFLAALALFSESGGIEMTEEGIVSSSPESADFAALLN
ncbi:MAG TPA: hypothetical protein P5079_09490, partial [Elusimicrobiota bacterium]|nr:hypothetical protein [Elusimicrobiota bacterium]